MEFGGQTGGEKVAGEKLLQTIVALDVRPDQRIENRQDMAPVFHHTGKNVPQLGLAFRFAMPLCQHQRRNLDILAELLRRMAAKEKPIEKCRFPLREVEVMNDF